MKLIVEEIEQKTPEGIAAAIGRLIASGHLTTGDRLPTVREMATELGVSPATISHAWQALSSVGLIVSRGRSGTFVREQRPQHWLTGRNQSLAGYTPTTRIDLSRGTPRPELLPELGPALSRVSERAVTSSYQELPVIPELLDVLRSTWSFPAESITVVDGALDAISRSLEQVARFGERVILENPSFPPFHDLLDSQGLDRIPVEVDEHGIVPAAFAEALRLEPAAVILQPRAHNPTGASMTAERAEELARLLQANKRNARTVVIEDDHSGGISTAPDVSLGRWLPERTVHVRSFSKSHGPDLRIAAMGGPADIVDRVVARRMLGPGWTSRMLQTILHELLTNGTSVSQVNEARHHYYSQQRNLVAALAEVGIDIPHADGINTWIPVLDEREAIVQLAASGIRVAPGTPFFATERPDHHIRVTVGALLDDVTTVAAAIAEAAKPSGEAGYPHETRWV